MISPRVHELQRQAGGGGETKCSRCGRRTRDRTGICRWCRQDMPDPKSLSVERILAHMEACRAELRRRREQLDKALGVETT